MRSTFQPATRSRTLQRKCGCSNASCSCGRKPLQRSSTSRARSGRIPSIVDDVVRSPGAPLPGSVRHGMEARLGHDFRRVRVHSDAAAADSARAVDAAAYTVDEHVVFGAGRWSPESSQGRRLLAHELAHVVQQTEASGTLPQMSEPGDAWEREADRVADTVGATPAAPAGTAPSLMREIISANPSPSGGGGRPPAGLSGCKVFLGGRRIDHWLAGTLGFRHLYLDAYRSATDYELIEGGPVGSTTTGTSGAWVKRGDWDARGVQWDITPANDCPSFIGCLESKTAAYHAAGHPYHYSNGPNSNSFVSWVLNECGVAISALVSSYPYLGIDYWLTHSAARAPATPALPAPAPP
jgi:hypothetical protein